MGGVEETLINIKKVIECCKVEKGVALDILMHLELPQDRTHQTTRFQTSNGRILLAIPVSILWKS